MVADNQTSTEYGATRGRPRGTADSLDDATAAIRAAWKYSAQMKTPPIGGLAGFPI